MGADLAKLYVTCKDREEAEALSLHLLQERLVSCANFFPVDSRYWWKGNIECAEEHVLLLTTSQALLERVRKEIAEKHSYDVPCILSVGVSANTAYAAWVEGEVK